MRFGAPLLIGESCAILARMLSMGWTEGVLVAALVLVRFYALGMELLRRKLREQPGERTSAEWLRFMMIAAGSSWLLLAITSMLAASNGAVFSAGVRVGMVLWVSELLVHLRDSVDTLKSLRAGQPPTAEMLFSMPLSSWSGAVFAIPLGALIGRWIGG
jgi:hypothetical protein